MNPIDIYNASDDVIEKIIRDVEKQLHFGVKQIGKDIINASAEILIIKKGVIDSDLSDAQKLHETALLSVDKNLSPVSKAINNGMKNVDAEAKKQFSKLEIFQDVDAERSDLELLKNQATDTFSFIGDEFADNAGRLFYDAVLTNMTYDQFLEKFDQLLIEGSSEYGKALDGYAETYIRDSYMKYYQDVHNLKADIAGLDDFLYYGNIMASSRAWCIVRVGQTFTKKQIDSWDGDSWKGKSCHPMICRGGYNCRHHWRPVRKEWIEGGVINVNSIFEEKPEQMTDSLRADIIKESKVISTSMYDKLLDREII